MSNRDLESPLTLSRLSRRTRTRKREAAGISPEANAAVSCAGYAHRGAGILDARVLKESGKVMSHAQGPRDEWHTIPWRKLEVRVSRSREV